MRALSRYSICAKSFVWNRLLQIVQIAPYQRQIYHECVQENEGMSGTFICSGPFHERFTSQFKWKFRSVFSQVVVKSLVWNCAHGTTDVCRGKCKILQRYDTLKWSKRPIFHSIWIMKKNLVLVICPSCPNRPKVPLQWRHVIMCEMASQITILTIVYSTVCSCTDQSRHQSSASLAFVRGIHRWPVN